MKPPENQPDLTFSASEAGFAKWHQQLDQHRRALSEKLGIPIGTKVRIRLRDFERPFDGVLEVVTGSGDLDPKFRLRGYKFDFSFKEIVSFEMI